MIWRTVPTAISAKTFITCLDWFRRLITDGSLSRPSLVSPTHSPDLYGLVLVNADGSPAECRPESVTRTIKAVTIVVLVVCF